MGLVGFSSADWELMSPRRLRLLWSGGLHCGTVRAFSANGVFPVSVDTAVALVLTRGDDARLIEKTLGIPTVPVGIPTRRTDYSTVSCELQ